VVSGAHDSAGAGTGPGAWRHDAAAFAALLDRAAAALRASPVRVASAVRLPVRGRLLVTGDVHDNTLHFEAAVRAARLGASPDHHLVLQEFLHGEGVQRLGFSDFYADAPVDMSHRLLARVAELVLEYPAQVHPILANHEIAQCRGHGITKGGVNCTMAFDAGLAEAYGDESAAAAAAVSRFVMAMPLGVVCANGAMVTHSLPSGPSARHFDLRVFERALVDEDFDPPFGAAHLLTWGRAHEPGQLAAFGREWGARVFIVGHEPAPEGVLVRPPNMVVLNTGHAAGRVIDLDLAAPAPEAAELAATAVPVSALLSDMPDGPGRTAAGDGERLA
jgi:hypothetical protein